MFGFVTANIKELTEAQKVRYNAVYCGICRQIRERSSQLSRLGLSYDMAFLALLLMSLYEPEEISGEKACALHPVKPKPWLDNECIRYAADMNVALAYFKAMDDWQDDHALTAKTMANVFGKSYPRIHERYPRQCDAIGSCIARLGALEKDNCPNADEVANCFGALMGELLVWKEDLWAPALRQMGMALGRFIYLADAAVDYREDVENNRYNPFAAMDGEKNWQRWEDFLILIMGRCTHYYEKLPLVQDKDLLDNILYSGVWVNLQGKKAREEA